MATYKILSLRIAQPLQLLLTISKNNIILRITQNNYYRAFHKMPAEFTRI